MYTPVNPTFKSQFYFIKVGFKGDVRIPLKAVRGMRGIAFFNIPHEQTVKRMLLFSVFCFVLYLQRVLVSNYIAMYSLYSHIGIVNPLNLTPDTTTKFVIMIIKLTRNLRSRDDS